MASRALGDPFPLPRLVEDVCDRDLRLRRRRLSDHGRRLALRAVDSLNDLAGFPRSVTELDAFGHSRLLASQRSVLLHVLDCVSRWGPPASDLTPRAAFVASLKSKDLYGGDAQALRPYRHDLVRFLKAVFALSPFYHFYPRPRPRT